MLSLSSRWDDLGESDLGESTFSIQALLCLERDPEILRRDRLSRNGSLFLAIFWLTSFDLSACSMSLPSPPNSLASQTILFFDSMWEQQGGGGLLSRLISFRLPFCVFPRLLTQINHLLTMRVAASLLLLAASASAAQPWVYDPVSIVAVV